MASLLRASAYGGSAFRRALLGREGLAYHGAFPFRRLSSSGAGQTPNSSSKETRDEKVFKIDQLQMQVDELNHLIEKDISELIELYKEYQQCDHIYVERLLTRCGVPKTRSRDKMIWRSQLAIMTVLSAGVGYVLGGSV